MKNFLFLTGCFFLTINSFTQPGDKHNLVFDSLAKRWDEGIPLGNGWLGAIIWQKGDNLRMSLDRVDLWDDRPMPEIDKLKFNWVLEQVIKGEYDTVQKLGDHPYEKYAAPTKIPAAAIEFDLSKIGKVKKVSLDIASGLSIIEFGNGIQFNNYIHAARQVGYFGFENIKDEIIPELKKQFCSEFQDKRPEDYLTRDEVCELLKIDLSSLHRWRKEGKIPSYGMGKRVYFKRSEIDTIINRNKLS